MKLGIQTAGPQQKLLKFSFHTLTSVCWPVDSLPFCLPSFIMHFVHQNLSFTTVHDGETGILSSQEVLTRELLSRGQFNKEIQVVSSTLRTLHSETKFAI